MSRAGGTACPATSPTQARAGTEDEPAHRKRGADLDPVALKAREEAEEQGNAMEDARIGATQGPWPPPQGEPQEVIPMDLSVGADFSAKEQEAWEKSKSARAKELGLELAAELASAAGRQEVPPGGRGTKTEGAAETAASAPARGDGTGKKIPSDGDAEEAAEPATLSEPKDPDLDDQPEEPQEEDL
jgi:hypothetical protein